MYYTVFNCDNSDRDADDDDKDHNNNDDGDDDVHFYGAWFS